MKKSTRKESGLALKLVDKTFAAEGGQPLIAAHPEAVLPLLEMIGRAKLSIEDLLGRMSREFMEKLLLMAAESVTGPPHPGRRVGGVRRYGRQPGVVNLGTAKLKVSRPRLRGQAGEIAVPGYAQLNGDSHLSERIADVLACGVSTRKYSRVMYRCADEMGISRSAVSRHFVRDSARALGELMRRPLSDQNYVAVYADGIIVGGHHIIAAVGVSAQGAKRLLGLASGSSENARVVMDLLNGMEERGLDLTIPRLWIIDGSKALRAAIIAKCGEDTKVQRCRIHKMRNVTDRLPKDKREQTRWLMTQAFKVDAAVGIERLKSHARHLKAQHADAATSLLEGLEDLFTINRLGVSGELARCLASTNIIESPNSQVRRVSGRVTRYRDVEMAMRWTATGFLEAEKSFHRVRGYQNLPALIRILRPENAKQLKQAA
jgi:transposase-like protein